MKIEIVDKKIFKSGNVTICKLYCGVKVPESDVYNFMGPRLVHKLGEYFTQPAFKHKLGYGYHTFEVEAKTVCGERDTYDEIVGKRIAEAKAYRKVYKIGRKISELVIDYLNQELANWDYAYNKYDDLIFDESDNLESLSNN